jgi:hypothetical protein
MQLIERKQVFESQKNIAKLIRSYQKDFFDEGEDSLEDEMFDLMKLNFEEVECENFVVEINHSELENYPKILTEKLIKLFEFLKAKDFVIISHLKLEFFSNLEHDFEKVINSYEKLGEITKSKSYKEAISINVKELEQTIEIFFWLNRCDASIPEFIFWTDLEERFCFSICKYGKLHFTDFTNGNLISNEKLKEFGFNKLEERCYDQFSEDCVIENRQLKWSDFEEEKNNSSIIQQLTAKVLRNWGFRQTIKLVLYLEVGFLIDTFG